MPIYSYKCPTHGEFDSLHRGDTDECPHCGDRSQRKFAWTTGAVLMDHYNPAFGTVISSRKQAAELAKKASEDQSERLGMTVDYELTDIHDHEAAGIDRQEAKEYAAANEAAKDLGLM